MNEAMKKENIQAFIQEQNLDVATENCLYAQIDAKLWKYVLFQGAAVLDIQHLLLFFGSRTLTMIGLTTIGNFTKSITTISYDQLDAFAFKKGSLLQSKLSFQIDKEKYVFKIPNVVLVAKWQKENLSYLREKNFFFKE